MDHFFRFASSIGDGAKAAAGDLATNKVSVAGIFSTVAHVLIYLVGAISVIVLIIGGLRYILSAGNPASVQGAKNTILYAIVGIVVAVAAYAIVAFVLAQFSIK